MSAEQEYTISGNPGSSLDMDGLLNILLSVVLVVHVAVLLGLVFVQKPWRACLVGGARLRFRSGREHGNGNGRD
jgi:hypothetical protein